MIEFAHVTIVPKDTPVTRTRKRKTLGEWMEDEMRKRRIGVNEFARLCGVSSGTISKHQGRKPPHPTPDFLRKLSQSTDTPVIDLLNIVYPEIEDETKVDAEAQALSRKIMKLPEKTRSMLIRIMESMTETGNNQ